MKTYYSVFKLRLINGLQYRAAALAGVATQFFWGFMFLMIYEAFYSSNISTTISFQQIVTFIWLQQAFFYFVMIILNEPDITNLIKSGDIAYELCRPTGIYGFWYAKIISRRLSGALLRCFPILIVSFFLPAPYAMTLPPSFLTFILFLITLFLGLVVVASISMLIHISIFATMSEKGSFLMFGLIAEFLGGFVIPVPFMPNWLQNIVYCLPFRLVGDLPFRVYSGNITTIDAVIGIGVQLIWIAILIWSGRALLNRMLKNVVVQGG